MPRRRRAVLQAVAVLTLLIGAHAISHGLPEYGPPKGALVIVGGTMKDPAIADRFVELGDGTRRSPAAY